MKLSRRFVASSLLFCSLAQAQDWQAEFQAAIRTQRALVEQIQRLSPAPAERVPVIWAFVGSRDGYQSVEAALASGRVTHVAIFAGNRVTSDTLEYPATQAAIASAKRHGAKLILVRYLWQTQKAPESSISALTNVDYYVSEITTLRREAAAAGIDLVGFDAEAYGDTELREHLRSRAFDAAATQKVADAVDAAVERAGLVDFVLPCDSHKSHDPRAAIARLGRWRISEATYYDRTDQVEPIRSPAAGRTYDIPGLYVDTQDDHPTHSHLGFFTPAEIWGEKRSLWERTGVFLWPREGKALEVARALAEVP